MPSGAGKPKVGYPTHRPYPSTLEVRRLRPVPDRIHRYYVPLVVLEATSRFMGRFGEEQRECYVWWGGYFTSDSEGQVVTALCPEIKTDFGRIHLDHRDLTTLHHSLRRLDQVLLIELHTHPPGAGGQNDLDAAHPAATYRGFISMVVPDFGLPSFYDLRKVHVYEYLSSGGWRTLGGDEIQSRFVIEEPSLTVKV